MEYKNFGSTNTELKEAVNEYKNVKYFFKNSDSMFAEENIYKSELSKYLSDKEVGNLVIIGANGGACVESSIEGALSNNCNVIAYNKGIADFNFIDFIYPYVYDKHIPTKCEDCTFKEMYRLENIFFEMTTKQLKTKKIDLKKINDQKREAIKESSDEKDLFFSNPAVPLKNETSTK